MKWFRNVPFSADYTPVRTESWQCRRDDGVTDYFNVSVRMGKPFDVLSLKGFDLAELRDYAASLADTARRLYCEELSLRSLDHCVCCSMAIDGSESEVLKVFDVSYVKCKVCGHVLVPVQPDPETLRAEFIESELHSSTYIDHAAIESRLRQVVAPKLQWCLEQFAAARGGRQPRSVIDVGAGGGHFLAASARIGLSVDGFEFSKASQAFASEAFGLELRSQDFLTAQCDRTDLLTFWGLLEYVPDPAPFIAAARHVLGNDGMLVIEVPRVDSLSTAVQSIPGAIIARHMDPTSHINGFSDESLMTLLVEGGFKPVAAWYFGMDVYETLMQMALRRDDATILESMVDIIPRLQQAVDLGRQCDDIIIAAIPMN